MPYIFYVGIREKENTIKVVESFLVGGKMYIVIVLIYVCITLFPVTRTMSRGICLMLYSV